MPFGPAEPITQPTYQTMQFDGTAQSAAEIVYAIDSGLVNRLLLRGVAEGYQEGDQPPVWRIRIQRSDSIDELVAVAGYWIVVSSLGKIRVLDDGAYRAEFVVPA